MQFALSMLKTLASRRLTVVLMAAGAVAMAAITIAEAVEGTGETPYRLYVSWWFTAFLWLVWINLACNAVRRSWWTRRKLPGILAHLGFLLILTGGFFTWTLGIRGSLPIDEGTSRSAFNVESPVLRVMSTEEEGGREYAFLMTDGGRFRRTGIRQVLNPFAPTRRVTVGGGRTVSILDVMPSARFVREIEEAPAGTGPAAIVLSTGRRPHQSLTLQDGDSVTVRWEGLSRIVFRRISGDEDAAALVRTAFGEFIEIRPPAGDPILIPFSSPGDAGREFTQGDYTVKVLEYHANFKMGREPLPDDEPLNPALKLEVNGPGGAKTVYAFALMEFHGNRLDDGTVIEYHRPGSNEGTLLVLARGSGPLEAHLDAEEGSAPLAQGQPLVIGEGSAATRVRLVSRFSASRFVERLVRDEMGAGLPAFLVLVGKSGEPAWLSSERGEALSADGKTMAVVGNTVPLGFTLALDDAVAEYWPASGIPRAYYSHVKVLDPGAAEPATERIETNAPLLNNGFRLYQSGMDQQAPYRWSVFSVARDPGLPFVTAGFLIMSFGLLWLYLVRFVIKPARKERDEREVAA